VSFWDDFRQGRDEARAARAARPSWEQEQMWARGVVARPSARQQNSFLGGLFGDRGAHHGEPAGHVDDGSRDWSEDHAGDWGGWEPEPHGDFQSAPQRDDSRLEALATLCEQQQSEIARRETELAGIGERLEQYVAAVAERDAAIATLRAELTETRATCERFKANGKKLLDEIKPLRVHTEAIQKLGWHAASKASHPDTAPPEQRSAREEIFKLIKTIFGRN
jgi:hypothetical protein